MQSNHGVTQSTRREIPAAAENRRPIHRRWPFLLLPMCTWLPAIALALGFQLVLGHDILHAQSHDESATRATKGDRCGGGTIPLTFQDGIALARIFVNQKPMMFIVDTAGKTMINSDRVALPMVRQIRTGAVTVSAAQPLELWSVVYVKSFAIAGTDFADSKILSRSLQPLESKLAQEVDGLLGVDVLRFWDSVSFDYKHKALVLERSGCPTPDSMGSLLRLEHDAAPVGR